MSFAVQVVVESKAYHFKSYSSLFGSSIVAFVSLEQMYAAPEVAR